MPFAGTFAPAIPGETKSFSIDFVNDLAAGDSLISATATLDCFYGSDPNVGLLLAPGPPAIRGTAVSQVAGNTIYERGFQPGVIYRWTVTAKTAGGWTLVAYAHLPCNAVA
jgi:hypothetical protein